ncbi:MAG: sigma-70 family RNA polymerase sigma factor [Bacteroidia bacterium]|nr:sigma-70 family RNA polymerase sigma factor [Bacteroidia bacterium]
MKTEGSMSLPERQQSERVLRKPAVSINFEKLEEKHLVTYFSKPEFKQDAYREVLRRYQHEIYRYMRNLLVSSQDAEAVTAQTFISLWNKIASVKWNAALRFTIYRLASNEVISFLRSNNKSVDFDQAQQEMSKFLELEQDVNTSLLEVKLQKALCYLPFKQKLVFVLSSFEGFDFDEIAELTQSDSLTLESTFEHAKKKLDIYLGVM